MLYGTAYTKGAGSIRVTIRQPTERLDQAFLAGRQKLHAGRGTRAFPGYPVPHYSIVDRTGA